MQLSFQRAPLDYMEISRVAPSVGTSVENSGDAAASDLASTITLPAGLTFAPPSGGGGGLATLGSGPLGEAMRFAADGEFTAGSWTCSLSDDRSTATCELPTLAPGTTAPLDLEVSIDSSLADDALTSFAVSAGSEGASYSVLTGVEDVEEDLDVDFATQGHAAAAQFGATLMGCDQSVPACAAVMASAASSSDYSTTNNYWMMSPLNEAGGNTSSASTTVDIPAGATVKYAVIEWSANRHSSDAFSGPLDEARLKGPGEPGFTDIAADSVSQVLDAQGRTYYVARADITDLVVSRGEGSWSLADIALPLTRNDSDPTYFAGFAITIVYEDPSLPDSRVAIFDGLQLVSPGIAPDFVFATDADANVTVGWTAWEADRGLVGDRATVDGVALTPRRWDGNSSSLGETGNAADGSAFGGAYGNSLGVDAKPFVPVSIGPGTHTIVVTTAGEAYVVSTLTVTVTYE